MFSRNKPIDNHLEKDIRLWDNLLRRNQLFRVSAETGMLIGIMRMTTGMERANTCANDALMNDGCCNASKHYTVLFVTCYRKLAALFYRITKGLIVG